MAAVANHILGDVHQRRLGEAIQQRMQCAVAAQRLAEMLGADTCAVAGSLANAAWGLVVAPRYTGNPTIPSWPTVATSSVIRPSATATSEYTDVNGNQIFAIGFRALRPVVSVLHAPPAGAAAARPIRPRATGHNRIPLPLFFGHPAAPSCIGASRRVTQPVGDYVGHPTHAYR